MWARALTFSRTWKQPSLGSSWDICLHLPTSRTFRSFELRPAKTFVYAFFALAALPKHAWQFPKFGGPYIGVLIVRVLLFRVLLYYGP